MVLWPLSPQMDASPPSLLQLCNTYMYAFCSFVLFLMFSSNSLSLFMDLFFCLHTELWSSLSLGRQLCRSKKLQILLLLHHFIEYISLEWICMGSSVGMVVSTRPPQSGCWVSCQKEIAFYIRVTVVYVYMCVQQCNGGLNRTPFANPWNDSLTRFHYIFLPYVSVCVESSCLWLCNQIFPVVCGNTGVYSSCRLGRIPHWSCWLGKNH